MEDDLALAREAAGAGLRAALVVCGVAAVREAVGDAVVGWLGPVQWDGDRARLPVPLPPGADYPAAQALAAGILAERALALAGSAEPGRPLGRRPRAAHGDLPRARSRSTREGRQTAHAPAIVRWEAGAGRAAPPRGVAAARAGARERLPRVTCRGGADADAIVGRLVDWFRREGADLPWRRTRDRYRILVAETQLQATPVARVLPYYARFIERWPTAADLARGRPRRRCSPSGRASATRAAPATCTRPPG